MGGDNSRCEADKAINAASEQTLVTNHGPITANDVYTKLPKSKPITFRTAQAQEHIRKLIETRKPAKARKSQLNYLPTPFGSVMDENSKEQQLS